MLGSFHRFHGHNTLTAVYRRGETVRGPQLSLKYSHRGSDKPYRVAVVVSRKVSKSAVVRNRIRRRIYEIVREFDSLIPSGTDLLFTAFNDDIADIDHARLKQSISQLLKKASSNRAAQITDRGIVNPEGKAS
jgi:ribonuclease P protein component